MPEPGDDHGVRGGVCQACELPMWMCEGNPACFAKELPPPPVIVDIAHAQIPGPAPVVYRPAVVRPDIEEPVLVMSVAHLVEVGFGDDLELRAAFERGHGVSGIWLVPHPDDKS